MSVTAFVYGKAPIAWLNKEVDIIDDTIKVMLLTSSYTPNQDTDDYVDDIVANEVTGTGYTAGGPTLANDTLTYTAGTNTLMYDADDVALTTSTITARVAAVYDSTPATNATRPLLCYQLSSSDIVSTGGTFSIVWNASGIFTVVAA